MRFVSEGASPASSKSTSSSAERGRAESAIAAAQALLVSTSRSSAAEAMEEEAEEEESEKAEGDVGANEAMVVVSGSVVLARAALLRNCLGCVVAFVVVVALCCCPWFSFTRVVGNGCVQCSGMVKALLSFEECYKVLGIETRLVEELSGGWNVP